MTPSNTCFLPMPNNIQICVPDTSSFMSNFVLREQGDWFEEEIHFVRNYIKPDMNVLDIGANYGVYCLSMANANKASGKLYAFEPTQRTADCLRASLAKNSFDHVELIQAGLSDKIGQATFYTQQNAELNSLTAKEGATKETIELKTLNACAEEMNWPDIGFIKLDAEGEEANILKASEKVLGEMSPLIMFELKHGNKVNIELISAFRERGYESYYLIPGLNCLAPFNESTKVDAFLLNLFCCKKDRAEELANSGLLVNTSTKADKVPWVLPSYLKQKSYFNIVEAYDNGESKAGDSYFQMLNFFAYASDETVEMSERYRSLLSAYDIMNAILKQGESRVTRLCSLARVTFEWGLREVGLKILEHLVKLVGQVQTLQVDEAFLSPAEEFDDRPVSGDVSVWLSAAILHQYIEKHAHSSYFTGKAGLPAIARLEALGYADDLMKKRRKLIETTFR